MVTKTKKPPETDDYNKHNRAKHIPTQAKLVISIACNTYSKIKMSAQDSMFFLSLLLQLFFF